MRALQIVTAILFFFVTPAMAKDGDPAAWIVAQKSGSVQVVRAGMQPASIQLRAALSPGDVVATGSDGRAMLTRGGDYVIVAPGSRLLLPKVEPRSGFTQLIQQVGTMLYKVRHTGVPHFAVETPMLAAVVKGTSFTVIVDKDRAAVQVTEGLVEVSSAAGSARRLVEGGMTVYVGRERPNEIIEMRPGAVEPAGASGGNETEAVKIESSGDVPLSTITGLTGGLVTAAPVVQAVAPPYPATEGGLVTTPANGSQSAAEVAETTVPVVTNPAVETVEGTLPGVAEPVVEVVETVLPPVIEPVVEVVETVLPPVTQPVVAPVVTPVTGLLGGLLGR
ncbi:MAG TPA: FecR family protein [Sphingomicrobium sp.]|nr:FecR family protein [Sphingomicrobium sp.]